MATPARTGILLDILSTLQGITVSNGYNTEVTAVGTTLLSREEARLIGEPPVLCFGPGKDIPTHMAFEDMRVVMPVVILGYIEETEWADRSAKLNLLIDDIIAVLSVDTTRGENCVSTYFSGFDTDEQDPDAATGLKDGGGTCIVELSIPYYRTVNAS